MINAKNLPPMLTLVIGFFVLMFFMKCMSKRSTYMLSPSPVMIDTSAPEASQFFNLTYDLDCVPGPQKNASYYTKDLTPGGMCGAQEFVVNQAEGYTITDGIGGSLMDQ
jgi:hypothetical protein